MKIISKMSVVLLWLFGSCSPLWGQVDSSNLDFRQSSQHFNAQLMHYGATLRALHKSVRQKEGAHPKRYTHLMHTTLHGVVSTNTLFTSDLQDIHFVTMVRQDAKNKVWLRLTDGYVHVLQTGDIFGRELWRIKQITPRYVMICRPVNMPHEDCAGQQQIAYADSDAP